MTAKTDAVLNTTPALGEVLYDIQFGADGDILTEDTLDTAILVSLFTDARAKPYEIAVPQYRRGWVGDLELTVGESYGSLLWLLEQARLTVKSVSAAGDYAGSSLEWLVEDNIALSVDAVGFIENGQARLRINLKKPNSQSETKFVELWERTGDN